MAEILCDQVGQGLRESERTVSVKDVHGRRQYITVEHDFLTVTPEKKYYLPVGVVHVDRKTGALLVELPHEAYSGANRLWVSSQDLLEPTETPAWAAGWCPGGNQANLTVPLPKRKSRPRPYPLHDRKIVPQTAIPIRFLRSWFPNSGLGTHFRKLCFVAPAASTGATFSLDFATGYVYKRIQSLSLLLKEVAG